MAIIRNERPQRSAPEPQEQPAPEEIEIDYRWHPTEDEFVSPLTAEQWAELMADPTFVDSDAAKAMRCLHDYGEPATFQQLSIRYRGTMGRYRRWLGEAAQRAGERFGVPAPQKDQFGMDEWWPLLYLTRATGKPGAGVFEMELRPEVEQAFALIDEQEKQAKRAENARQLQRIEQLERARREERERRAAREAKAAEAARVEAEAARAAAEAVAETIAEPALREQEQAAEQAPERSVVRTVAEVAPVSATLGATAQPAPPASASPAPEEALVPSFPALNEFLEVMAAGKVRGGSRYAGSTLAGETAPFDVAGPIDYALRYAERLRGVLALMREGNAGATAAAMARAAGDKSVRRLQDILNGQEIPDFDYLDTLRERLFVNPDYLEALDGQEDNVPAFVAYDELLAHMGLSAALDEGELPQEIAYVVDDSGDRHTGVVLRFSALRCALLTRMPVKAQAKRAESDELDAFVRMVDELDEFARAKGIERTNRTVSAGVWDKLASGHMWPGAVL